MWDDCRNAFRHWRRAPGTTAVAVLSLTLGISGTLGLFSLVDALLLRTLPVHEPERLTRIVGRDRRPGEQHEIVLPTRVWQHVREHQTIFESVLAVGTERVNIARSGEARYADIAYVSANYFDVLGRHLAAGRAFDASDAASNNVMIAVISHSLWQRDYGGRTDIAGQPIYLDQHRFDIIGVAPEGFFGLEVGRIDEVIVPLAAQDVLRGAESRFRSQSASWLQVYGRLHPGSSFDAAAAAMRAWYPALRAATLARGVPDNRHLPYQLDLAPAAHGQSFIRQRYAKALSLLLAAVSVLLLIACTNVAVLALARFSDRHHEIGVRLSLGATRARIMRLLLTDSMLLAGVSGTLGLWLGHTGASAIAPLLSVTRANAVGTQLVLALDARTMGVALVLTLATAVIAGLAPAVRSTSIAPLASMNDQGRGGTGSRRTLRTMRGLAGAQVALSLALLVAGTLLVRSFVELTTRATGIDRDRVLVAAVTDPFESQTSAAYQQRIERLKGALVTIPGVTDVSAGIMTPLTGMMAAARLRVPGSLELTPTSGLPPFNYVLPGFFTVLGTPFLMGRDFNQMDVGGGPVGHRGAAIVNQAFAQRHFGGFNPLGRVLIVGDRELEIVGVVANARAASLREDRNVPFAYGALPQHPQLRTASLRFVLRSEDPERLSGSVVRSLRAIDPRILVELRTLDDAALSTINRERLLAAAAGTFALLGLVIALAGVYGTFAYAVVRRHVEIGVRLALGASPANVVRLFLSEAAVTVGAGLVIGTAIALAGSRYLQSLLVGLSARDGASVTTAVTCMLLVSVVASLIPARRAAAVQPSTALRPE